MVELVLGLVLKILGVFIDKAEERAAWEKAIRSRLKDLDATSNDDSNLRTEYDKLQEKLKNGKKSDT